MSSTSVTSYIAAQAPVPTIFTPPAFCGKFLDSEEWLKTSRLTSCVPTQFLKVGEYFSSAYYSPAICPAGYTVDCSRFDTDQGPSVKTGETAVICCPSYFTCNRQASNQGCISGRKSSTVTALSVQIRWQSSDLSLLQTPPLITGLPSSSRHLGWEPESSLTFPYVLPEDCSSISDLYMPFDKPSCEPLTGTYYSPAICPSGWTAEVTLTSDDFYGPPRETDETVAICCPSGMSRLPGICGRGDCVSATITTKSSTLSLKLLQVRDGVQIRWAPTDIAVLETHPLTPGLRLPRQTVTINPLPSPRGLYKVGIGLAILPMLFSLVAVTLGAILLHVKRHAQKLRSSVAQRQVRRPYKPAIFSPSTFVLLISVIVTSIALLELSCHVVLPVDAPDPYPQLQAKSNSSTNAPIVAVGQITSTPGTFTLPMGISCWSMSFNLLTSSPTSISSRTRSTLNYIPRSTITSDTVTALAARLYDDDLQTTTVCATSGTPVIIPTCNRGAGAPRREKWLASEQQGSGSLIKLGAPGADGAYFIANMLPTLLSSLFSIPWKIMQLDAAMLEPFRQLAAGSTASKSILGNYQGLHARRAPVPLITTCIVYASAAVTALSAEGWGLQIVGSCDKNVSMEGCFPVMQVTPKVVRVIMAILAVVAVLAIVLAGLSRRYVLGVYADPRSIVGVAVLAQSSGFRSIFANVDPKAGLEGLRDWMGHVPLHLGTEPSTQEYGIQRSEQSLLPPDKDDLETSDPRHATQLGQMPVLKLAIFFGCFTMFLTALTAFTTYYLVTSEDTAFERFMSGEGFGPRFIFAICGVAVNFGWVSIFQVILRLMPYYAMHPTTSASKSILQPYACDHFSCLASALRRRNRRLALIALPVVLSEFLPLLLATVPYHETTTWRTHLVSSWVAVSVLCAMILIMLVVTIVLVAARPVHYLNAELLTKAPLVATLLLLSGSGCERFLRMWREYSRLDSKERDMLVLGKEIMFGLSTENWNKYPSIRIANDG